MAAYAFLELNWNNTGQINYQVVGINREYSPEFLEGIASFCSIALLDHSLSILESHLAVELSLEVLDHIFDNSFEVKPINDDLVSAQLEIHLSHAKRGGIFTIFKPKAKFIASDSNLQLANIRLVVNYLSILLAKVSPNNVVPIKIGVFDWLAIYQNTLQTMFEDDLDRKNAKKVLLGYISNILSGWPHEETTSKLNAIKERIEFTQDLKTRWKTLPTVPGKAFLQF